MLRYLEQPVALDASRTYHPDGQALTFAWGQEMGPAVVWSTGRDDSTVEVILQDIGTHRFELEVSDGANSAIGVVEVIGLTSPPEDEDEEVDVHSMIQGCGYFS